MTDLGKSESFDDAFSVYFDRSNLPLWASQRIAALQLGIAQMCTSTDPTVLQDFERDEDLKWPKLILSNYRVLAELFDIERQAIIRIRELRKSSEFESYRFLEIAKIFFEGLYKSNPENIYDLHISAIGFCIIGMYHPDPFIETSAAIAVLKLCKTTQKYRNKAARIIWSNLGERYLNNWPGNKLHPIVSEMALIGVSIIEETNKHISKFQSQTYKSNLSHKENLETKEDSCLIVHGTLFQKHNQQIDKWWKPETPPNNPAGDLHQHLTRNLRINVYNREDFFEWSGAFTDHGRDEAANNLESWVNQRNLANPIVFAHSHGCNVAMIASRNLSMDKLVLMSCPVWPDYQPSERVGKVLSIRTKWDLVIMADGGAQRFPPNPKIYEIILPILFDHSASHESGTWIKHGIDNFIKDFLR